MCSKHYLLLQWTYKQLNQNQFCFEVKRNKDNVLSSLDGKQGQEMKKVTYFALGFQDLVSTQKLPSQK